MVTAPTVEPAYESNVTAGRGEAPCGCTAEHGPLRRVVVTGGPGAGKTAVLELARKRFCHHVVVLHEAAGILYGGGFPRHTSLAGRHAAQRAIYHIQDELEQLVIDEGGTAVALCDRGTVDGLAYWPSSWESYWEQLGTSLDAELARYTAVIHLRPPPAPLYNHDNPLRTESQEHAIDIDARIEAAWERHPRRFFVTSTNDFLSKTSRALALMEAELPACCHNHASPA